MSPMRPTARRIARKLLLLPVLVAALLVVLAPATANPPFTPKNGSWSETGNKFGTGDARKIK